MLLQTKNFETNVSNSSKTIGNKLPVYIKYVLKIPLRELVTLKTRKTALQMCLLLHFDPSHEQLLLPMKQVMKMQHMCERNAVFGVRSLNFQMQVSF